MTLNKHTWMIGMALFFIGTTKQRKGNGTDNQRSKEYAIKKQKHKDTIEVAFMRSQWCFFISKLSLSHTFFKR